VWFLVGVLTARFRELATDHSLASASGTTSGGSYRKWLVLDGPVDPLWAEQLNTVLDETRKLCVPSGQMIAVPEHMNVVCEVGDLAHATPATISRCSVVCVLDVALWNKV
jgi:dynein heavy chain